MLLVSRKDAVVTLTINRPQARNSLHPDLLRQLAGTFGELAGDGTTRCVVLRGAGDKAFSAGYDISSIPDNDARTPHDTLGRAVRSVSEFPFPVIAMIQGYCIGGGCELAMSCDIHIADENARFAMPPAKLGVLYHPSGVQKFINLIGVAWTKYLFCSGRQIDAVKAREIGLVEEVVPAGKLEEAVYGLANEIAANAPLSVLGAKETVSTLLRYQQITVADADRLLGLVDKCFCSEDVREGKRAFAEKRKPVFTGV